MVEELSGRYGWADAAYVPRPYPGRVALFWSRARVGPHPRDLTLGWHNVAKDVDVYVIPGSHRTSVTTYGDVLATRLQACLSKAQARAPEFHPLSYGTSREV